MKVVGVVGLPASGKGEFSRIAQEMGIPVVVMGDVIRAELTGKGIPPTDENLGKMSGDLRERLGRDAIAQLSIPAIEAQTAPVVLVDGIRSEAEVQTFREHFCDFILVGIVSSFEVRYERLRNRRRSDDPVSRADLRVRDERELGWGLGTALAIAEHTLENNGSMEEFSGTVRRMLSELGEGS
jgi:dephospho-CoA kinase